MDDYKLHTPEQVEIAYTVSGLGTRFLALMVDGLIQGALMLVVLLSLGRAYRYSLTFYEWYVAIVLIVLAVVNFGYFLILELIMRGRTPGKAAAGIRVVRMDGRPADYAGILLRNLVRLIDWMPVFYTIGVISMFINRNSRRLGDLAGGTVVIVDRKRTTLDSVVAQQQSAPASSPLGDGEQAMVRDFLGRRHNLSDSARAQLAANIAAPLYDRLGIHPSQRTAPEMFLRDLLYAPERITQAGTQQPAPAFPQPSSGFQQPPPAFPQSQSGFQQPAPSFRQSPDVRQTPPGYQQPAPSFRQPLSGSQQPAPPQPSAVQPPPGALTRQDYDAVNGFFARCEGLPPTTRADLAASVAQPLYDKLRVPFAQRTAPEDFLRGLQQTPR